MDIKELDGEYIAHTYGRFPVQLEHGNGCEIYDDQNKKYIDLGGGIAVNTFGVSDPVWVAAVTDQLSRLQHTSNLYYSEPCARLAKMLCDRTGMKKVFFSNSGAEANECAIKVARAKAFHKYGDESHSTVITLKNSFHGRTITTLAATGQDKFHTEFGPFTGGFIYAEANNDAALEKLCAGNNCCAILMETIQGEGGINVLTDSFVKCAAKLCEKYDMLLMIDEVQTGNGRSGKLYSYMHYDVTPDVVSTAKGLAGGLPLGATMLGERAADVLTPGSHGSTFGGNPVCAAGAVSILSRIDKPLLDGVLERSKLIVDGLTGAKGVSEISGRGLMLGVKCEKPAGDIAKAALEAGVLVLTAKDKVRLLPPLNIPMDKLSEAINILKEVIA